MTSSRLASLWIGVLVISVAILSKDAAASHSPTPQNFKVAFIGDQGLGSGAAAVLNLIKDEGTDLVLHQGDLGYSSNVEAWDQLINSVLGNDFPYFASVGNHDCISGGGCGGPGQWATYQQKLADRLERVDGASCVGDLGVNSSCSYQGIFFILSGVGTLGQDHTAYIRDQLVADNSIWRICSWHTNMTLMQVGDKFNAVGWGAYEECRKGGAIVATAHHHSYSRSHLMDGFEPPSIASTSNTLKIEKGKTFAFVSGPAGNGPRPQIDELAANPWWAAVYTSTQSPNFGALFCTLNEGGIEGRAHCSFKDIDGIVVDDFNLKVSVHGLQPVPATSVIGLVTLAGL